jgi:hypothetical protein
MKWIIGVPTALCAVLCAVTCSVATGAATPQKTFGVAGLPPLSLSSSSVTAGETVSITGTHWPPHRVLQAAICGRGAVEGSQDCDMTGAITFGPADNGVVDAPIVVTVPPVPCPCVVLVTQATPSAAETLPINITGAPRGPLPTSPNLDLPRITVSNVHVVSDSSWTSWFGAAANRELVLTVHNEGASAVRAQIIAHWVRGSDHYVIASPPAQEIPVGESTQMSAPFALSTFSHGDFAVLGQLSGGGFQEGFQSSTSTTPWALYVLIITTVLCVLAMIATAVLRRRRNETDGSGDGDELVSPDASPTASDAAGESTAQLIDSGAMR